MPVEPWAIVGGIATALVSAVVTMVLLVARGKLIPVSTVEKLEARYKESLADKNAQIAAWQAIAERERENASQTRAQLDKILVVADTTERLMIAMRDRVVEG